MTILDLQSRQLCVPVQLRLTCNNAVAVTHPANCLRWVARAKSCATPAASSG